MTPKKKPNSKKNNPNTKKSPNSRKPLGDGSSNHHRRLSEAKCVRESSQSLKSPSESEERKKPTTRCSSVALHRGNQASVAKGSGKQASVAKGSLSLGSNGSSKQSNEEKSSSCSLVPSSESSNCELSSDYVSESEHSSSVASAGSCSVVWRRSHVACNFGMQRKSRMRYFR
jgi:hypothetical protein